MTTWDVGVVGAGPAGSAIAALLARRGYRVVILDRFHFPRRKACAEYCSPGVEDVLRRLGVWPGIASKVHRLAGMNVCIDGRPVLPIRYGESQERLAFTMPRTELDEVLVRHAAKLGATLIEGVQVKQVDRQDGVWRIGGERSSGGRQVWTSRILIGADGLHSTVTRLLGIYVRETWPRRIGLIAHYRGRSGPSDVGEMHVGPGCYCGLAPLPDGMLNVGLVASIKPGRRRPAPEVFVDALRRLPVARARLQGLTMSGRLRGTGPMSRRVAPVAGPDYVLVGDAAGFLDPFTGEGIFRALRGAELAADDVDRAFATRNGVLDSDAHILARRGEFAAKERLTWLIQMALASPDAFRRLCRNLSRCPDSAGLMGNVLGDLAPASGLLRPAHVVATLRG